MMAMTTSSSISVKPLAILDCDTRIDQFPFLFVKSEVQ